jgi:folate-binding protein YgfZ
VQKLPWHEFHAGLGAAFVDLNGAEIVGHYGDPLREHSALIRRAGVLDLSCRTRLCLLGPDRQKFLNGQVTNDVKALAPGAGCYAALVSAKGKLQADLFVYCLDEELLLDAEPGFADALRNRLEKYIIADDVQVADASTDYGLLSVQGPEADKVVSRIGFSTNLPAARHQVTSFEDVTLGRVYIANQPRLNSAGYDLFVPTPAVPAVADKLVAAARALGGGPAGWDAFEIARVEAGIPRFPVDMDETNLAPEAGLENSAISYTKGCYIGQEIIARLRTYGHPSRRLRGLVLEQSAVPPPKKADKLVKDGKEVGYVTSAVNSPRLGSILALAYVRREVDQPGDTLLVRSAQGEIPARITHLPFELPGIVQSS